MRLWEILNREVVSPKTGKKKQVQIFPRYHQLDVVRKLLADVREKGAGQRYLIQHSAGSGKSNSIAWLAHQLISARNDGKEVFDSIIVVTDRRLLDDHFSRRHNREKILWALLCFSVWHRVYVEDPGSYLPRTRYRDAVPSGVDS